jgi:hypothetical protein
MELHFERPSLVLSFYYPEQRNYLTLHTHDDDLSLKRKRVIYLCRNPVDTVFSQLSYKEAGEANDYQIEHWSRQYALHLRKWLTQSPAQEQLTLTYEMMNRDLSSVFEDIAKFLKLPFSTERLKLAGQRVSKQEVKERTKHDPRVVQIRDSYEMSRTAFRRNQPAQILSVMHAEAPELKDHETWKQLIEDYRCA